MNDTKYSTGISVKYLLKAVAGRHYEPWIQRPYAALHPRHLMLSTGRWAQRRVRNCGRQPAWSPSRWFLGPVLETIVRIVEQRYAAYYRRFGLATSGRPYPAKNRHGLLLVSGTLCSGGSERQTVLTALGLAKRKLQPVNLAVVYLQSESQRFYLHKLEVNGMRVHEIGSDHTIKNNQIDMFSSAIKKLPAMIHDVARYAYTFMEQNPQVVHLWLDEVNIKGGLAAVATGVPRIILSGRNLPPNNYLLYQPYMREAYRWLLQQPGVTLINNSAAGASAYEKWLGLPKNSIQVVHNGFDFDEDLLVRCRNQRAAYRERHGIPQNAPLIGAVIRLNEEKRPLLWAKIAARIRKTLPEAHFLVVGDGPLRTQLEARASHPDLSGHLHMAGLEKQALEAMAAMNLFLLSSRGEGLPNVLVEAQALGVPVVTTNVGGAPEALDHGSTGWILSSDNPEVAATEIVRLLQDESWLRAASKAGPEFVKAHFALGRMLDETLRIYSGQEHQFVVDKKLAFQ